MIGWVEPLETEQTAAASVALAARGLSVSYATPAGALAAVRRIDLELRPGETLALLGESGCGKSTLGRALLGMVRAPGSVAAERIALGALPERNLARATEREWRGLRGRQIALAVQDPMQALNPLQTIGAQLLEALRIHRPLTARAARARGLEMLAQLEFAEPQRIFRAYPFQLSGGMCQRAALAIALINEPAVLVADEPTTALDARVQRQVLTLLRRLQRDSGLAVLLIAHDVDAVAQIADRVAVMYAGRIVETGAARDLLAAPGHPYTRALLACLPRPGRALPDPLPGQPPLLINPPERCAFLPRCAAAAAICEQSGHPPLVEHAGGAVACWRAGELAPLEHPVSFSDGAATAAQPALAAAPALEVRDLAFSRSMRTGLRRVGTPILRDVSLQVRPGETLGLVGESGCGKTTLARCILGLLAPAAGEVRVGGALLSAARGEELRLLRQRIQPVFQDARGSLNRQRQAVELVAEPLRFFGRGTPAERRARAAEMLELVGLPAALHHRAPPQLSTGQCQRVAIARALVLEPAVLVCDEPVSALDLSVQAQILGLFARLQARLGFAMLLISHSLRVVQTCASRVIVMDAGRICEELPAARLREDARHPHTQALLAAWSEF